MFLWMFTKTMAGLTKYPPSTLVNKLDMV